jgi:hypothetical protein
MFVYIVYKQKMSFFLGPQVYPNGSSIFTAVEMGHSQNMLIRINVLNDEIIKHRYLP